MPFEFCNADPPKFYDGPQTSRCELPKGHGGLHLFRNHSFFGWIMRSPAEGEPPPEDGIRAMGRFV